MINWRERLLEARVEGRSLLTAGERELLRSFKTCLVGEQHERFPEVVHYTFLGVPGLFEIPRPEDLSLRRLGVEVVTCRTVAATEAILDQVEDRVLQLKRGE